MTMSCFLGVSLICVAIVLWTITSSPEPQS